MRAILREAGVKLGTPSRKALAGRVRAWAGDDPTVELVEPLPSILATMSERRAPLTKRVQGIARNDGVRRMTGEDHRQSFTRKGDVRSFLRGRWAR